MPSLLPRPDRWARSLVLSHRLRPSPDYRRVGSCISCFGACSAFTRVTACRLAKSPKATLYTEGFSSFVTSTTAPIATGWSEPVPRVGLSPTVNQRLFTAHDKVELRRANCGCLLVLVHREFGYDRRALRIEPRQVEASHG